MKKNQFESIVNDYRELKNKNVFITGPTSGIGKMTSSILASVGANVFFLARNIDKANKVKEEILQKVGDANITIINLDVANKKSIDSFINQLEIHQYRIDVFFQNAGVYNLPFLLDSNGFERTMVTNYLGPFYLLKKIMPILEKQDNEVKIIIQSSLTYPLGKVNENDFFMKRRFKAKKAYMNSKLALVHLYNHLFLDYSYANIKTFLVHPGAVYTPLIANAYPRFISKLAEKIMPIFFNDLLTSTLPTLLAMNDKEYRHCIYGPRGLFQLKGKPKKHPIKQKCLKNYQKTIGLSLDLLNIE